MPYASRNDLIAYAGADEIEQREMALGGDAVTKALADADAEIDSYLCGRYQTPVPVSANITRVAKQIARYYLLGSSDDDRSRRDYDDAIRWLKDIQAGRAALINAPVKVPGSVRADTAQVFTGRSKVFGGGLL